MLLRSEPSTPATTTLQSILDAAEGLAFDFGTDAGSALSPLISAALVEQQAQGIKEEDEGNAAMEFQQLLVSSGWDASRQSFRRRLDPRAFASNLKAVMLSDLQLVGKGAYSFVYKAKNRLDGSTVMLKRLRVDGGSDGLSATTIREMSLLRELAGSPYIVRLLDVLYDRQLVYLVMEHLDGDLHEHLQTNPNARTSYSIKRYLWQMLSGMEYAHMHRVIHRDLKPQNILLDRRTNCIKIADFGLSRTYLPQDTRPYTLEVVTLLYRCPELLLGAKCYTTAVDVWSLGCIFAEMVCGSPLFMGDSEIGQLYQIFKLLGTPDERSWPGVTQLPEWQPIFPRWKAQNLAENVPGLDAEGIHLLSRMLCIYPEDRISCKQALAHPYFNDIRPYMDRSGI